MTPISKTLEIISGLPGASGVLEGNAVLATIPRAEGPALLRALITHGIDIDEARWVGADLESVFMTETGSVQTPEMINAR